jgi:hypothetical protein
LTEQFQINLGTDAAAPGGQSHGEGEAFNIAGLDSAQAQALQAAFQAALPASAAASQDGASFTYSNDVAPGVTAKASGMIYSG